METKDTKEIITKKSISEELIFHSKVSMPFAIITAVLAVIVLIPISVILINYVINGFRTGDFSSVRSVFGVAVALLAAALLFMVGASVFIVIDLFRKSAMAKKGEFKIETDELLRKAADETVTRRTRRMKKVIATEDAFYFVKYGRHVVSNITGSAFEYSSDGDIFYIVTYNVKRPKPVLIYNSKVYEYREEQK